MLTPDQIRTMPYQERVRRISDLLATAALRLRHEEDSKRRTKMAARSNASPTTDPATFVAEEIEKRIIAS